MAASFDPVKFVRAFTSEVISDVKEFAGIEPILHDNITKCFTAENAPKLQANLTPAEIRAFRERITLLTTSEGLSRVQKEELLSLRGRLEAILSRTPTPPRIHATGAAPSVSTIASAKASEREINAIRALVKEANKRLAPKGIRLTEASIMQYVALGADKSPLINEHGYIQVHLPWIKNPSNSDETLQLFVKVDSKGNYADESEEYYLSSSEREHYEK